MCKTVFDDNTETLDFQSKIKGMQDRVNIIETSLAIVDSCNQQLLIKDSLLSTKLPDADQLKIEKDTSVLLRTKSLAANSLKANHGDNLMMFQDSLKKMNILRDRCPIIRHSNWLQYSPNQTGGIETLLGWLITALALTLGAPFWFDLLSKLVSVRGANNKATQSDSSKTPIAGSTASPSTVNANTNSGGEAVG